MDARIVEFAEVLRQNGVRVSTSEVQDAALAAVAVGVGERASFRAALEATLVKRTADVPTFQRVFEYFFSGVAQTFAALDRSLAKQLEELGLLEGDELKMVLATLENLGGGLTPLTKAIVEGDRAQLAQLFRAASLQLDLSRMESTLQTGFFSRRLMAAAGGDGTRADLKALSTELTARGLRPEGVEIVSRHLAGALREVEQAARREIEAQARARVRKPGEGTLGEKNLTHLTRAELEQLQGAVRRLAEKLKSRMTRRQRHQRRGALNVRRTLRRNLPWDGIPMIPVFHDKRPERPDVVILCDVSDSVRNTSRLMLLFTHTLQTLFARVRSFVFVSEVGEVTRYFREESVEDAIDLATAGKAVSLTSNSNYGLALARFTRDQLGSITRRTTVLIIGDGRNNYNPSSAWALRDLQQKARRVVWICPEDKRNWGFGDSEMHVYAKYCHQVAVVQSLSDLERLAEQLVPV